MLENVFFYICPPPRKFSVFPPYHLLKVKIPKSPKLIFWYSRLVAPCIISSSWDNLEPSYAQNWVFDVCPPREGRRRNFAKPVLVGVRASKPICTPKFVIQSTSESPGPWVSEWVHALFYTFHIRNWCSSYFKNHNTKKLVYAALLYGYPK